ncbi:PREDICTED: breakpoint cluster region protein-like [Priapulus caudatus]|uniref:Breakpoint cluster region protein-like n=1 Tax=Priapulus caudatus TaxID=37621 RepID=A0ABM1EJQ0_PRICU|nr:PREDICTED: breakpoint cluster region protein-like [Priapulus caudatus]
MPCLDKSGDRALVLAMIEPWSHGQPGQAHLCSCQACESTPSARTPQLTGYTRRALTGHTQFDYWGRAGGDEQRLEKEKSHSQGFPEVGGWAVPQGSVELCKNDKAKKDGQLMGRPNWLSFVFQGIKLKSIKETLSLEELLHRPVARVQKNALVLHDLLKYTTDDHPDKQTLNVALKMTQCFLKDFNETTQRNGKVPSSPGRPRLHLVKDSFIIELSENHRKLRHVFLFENALVCAKQKLTGRHTFAYECKWYIPLSELLIVEDIEMKDGREQAESQRAELEVLRGRVSQLREQLRREEKLCKQQKSGSRGGRVSRTVLKLRKKLAEQETALVLALPNLVLRVCHRHGKTYTFLVSSDYERLHWRDVVSKQQIKEARSGGAATPVNIYDLQETLGSIKTKNVSQFGAVLINATEQEKEETMTGDLCVTIHSIQGLQQRCDTFCCLEMDSYGHFFLKARTNICLNTNEPHWDQEFVLEMEGSQTLRILVYEVHPSSPEVLLGKGTLELSESWLKDRESQRQTIIIESMLVTLSFKFISAKNTLRRLPSRWDVGVFGVNIRTLCKKERSKVPFIVTACVTEVERRGIREMGIYRVSGALSEVQKLKSAFETSQLEAARIVCESDIHAVASVLKLYLRELPEPLFTDKLYPDLRDSFTLSDPEARRDCMLQLLNQLPEINYRTVLYLIDHMIRLNKFDLENKMSLHNLATVFGPTLLRPAAHQGAVEDAFAVGTMDVMSQMHILLYYLQMLANGYGLKTD